MSKEIWELVLIDDRGREQARALRLSSKREAEEFANKWNWEKSQFNISGRWHVSPIEGQVA